MRSLVYLIIVIAVCGSCEPPVVFNQPYPVGQPNLDEIPSVFQGVYLCESDSTLVRITGQNIIHESYYSFTSKLDELEEKEDCTIKDDQMFIKGMSECVPLKYINDSVVRGEYLMVDTLFKNKSNAFARLYKGHLILSQKLRHKEWMVHFLTPEQSDLYYRAIVDESNLSEIDQVTTMESLKDSRQDSPRYRIKPSNKEFDLLIENRRIFVECEYLIHVNLEITPNCKYPIKSNNDIEFKY